MVDRVGRWLYFKLDERYGERRELSPEEKRLVDLAAQGPSVLAAVIRATEGGIDGRARY